MEKSDVSLELHPAILPVQARAYAERLSEDDILSLCDLFLTPGIHYVTFATLDDGRRTMKSFVDVLTCYRTIGYVDNVSSMRYEQGMNIYDLFKQYREQSSLQRALDDFFINTFDYDFIWMVQNRYKGLRLFNWVFLNEAIGQQIDQRIPIVCIGVSDTHVA